MKTKQDLPLFDQSEYDSMRSHSTTTDHRLVESETTAPVQPNSSSASFDLATLSQTTRALFSTASTPEEVAALRDEILRRVAECADAVRASIAAEAERHSAESKR